MQARKQREQLSLSSPSMPELVPSLATSAIDAPKTGTSITEPAVAADTPKHGPATAAEDADLAQKPQADTDAGGKLTAAAEVPTAEGQAAGTMEATAAAEARSTAQASSRTQAAAAGQAAVPELPAAVPAAVLAGQVFREADIRAVLY